VAYSKYCAPTISDHYNLSFDADACRIVRKHQFTITPTYGAVGRNTISLFKPFILVIFSIYIQLATFLLYPLITTLTCYPKPTASQPPFNSSFTATNFKIPSTSSTNQTKMSSHHQSSRHSSARPTAQHQPSSSRTMPEIAVMGTGHSVSRNGGYLEVPASRRPLTSASHRSSAGTRSASRGGMLEVPQAQAGRSSSGTRSSASASHHSASHAKAGDYLQVPGAQPGRSSSGTRSGSGPGSHHPPSSSRTVIGSRSGDHREPSHHPSRSGDHRSADAMIQRDQTPPASARPSTSRQPSSSMLPTSSRQPSAHTRAPASCQSSFAMCPAPSGTTRHIMEYEHTSVRYYTESTN
jgi:hypothetical protein